MLFDVEEDRVVEELLRAEVTAFVVRVAENVVALTFGSSRGTQRMQDGTVHLSKYLGCASLGTFVFDDDVFAYILARDGRIVDHHLDMPKDWGGGKKTTAGNPEVLVKMIGNRGSVDRVSSALGLRNIADHSLDAGDGLPRSVRHAALLTALDLPEWLAGFGVEYVQNADLPDDILKNIRRVGMD